MKSTSGRIPHDWQKSVFVPISKNNNANKCENFRLITLIGHVQNQLLKIMNYIDKGKFGFQEGIKTREALFGLTVLLQTYRDQQKDVYICSIDNEKVFAEVLHTVLFYKKLA